MERLDWKRIFRFNIFMLKVTGVWPTEGSYGCNLYTLYAIVSILIVHIVFISTQTINLYFIKDDLKSVTGTTFILLTDMSASLKTYGLIKNMKMLKQLIITVNYDLFQPKNPQQKNLILPNIRAWQIITFLIWFFSVGCLVLWSLFPILDKSFQEYRLPFLAWYPYNAKTSPQYELTYAFQVVCVTILAVVNVNIDSLISYLNMFIGAQFDILCDDIRNIRTSDKNDPCDFNRNLIRCVHHHREILKFAKYANRFYNWLILVQFLVDGISIGLALFQLTVVVPFSGEFHSLVSFANALAVQVFLYCWFGNEIEVKSGKLPLAFFESDWIDASPKIKKNMLFFGLRLQRSLQISAFGLFALSMDTFLKITKTGYSYFALLSEINAPQ